jgi:Ca2+-binding EF-hand superfamily protein
MVAFPSLFHTKESQAVMKQLFLATLTLAFWGTATAQTTPAKPPSDWEARFKAADKDNDGTLDKTEAATMPGLAKHFDAVDTDKDGTVDMKEVKAHHATMHKQSVERVERRFKATDTDNDGTIDKKEAAAWPGLAKRFETVDVDKDGTVDLPEVKAAMGKRQSPPATVPGTAATPEVKK